GEPSALPGVKQGVNSMDRPGVLPQPSSVLGRKVNLASNDPARSGLLVDGLPGRVAANRRPASPEQPLDGGQFSGHGDFSGSGRKQTGCPGRPRPTPGGR